MLREEIELLGNDDTKVFLGGFSMGSFVSLYTNHVLERQLGGILIIGGLVSTVAKLPEPKNLSPMLIVHGMKDTVLKWKDVEPGFRPFMQRPDVQTVIIEDMKHD